MIDVHSHILPSMDNGPSTIAESIAMAKQAAKLGIKKIIATPHHLNGIFINEPENILGAIIYFNEKLREEKVPVKILPGQVTMVYDGISEDIKNGKLLPLNADTRYISIELPPTTIPNNIETIIYDIQRAGYIPIISNPEINNAIIENPNILYRLVKNGALIQASAGSIAGNYGKKVQKHMEKLLDARLIHFLGSNAYNSTEKGIFLKEAVEHLKKFDKGIAYQLIHNNESLIHGHAIPKNEPTRISVKKWSLFK
ncbi:tyrosine-protein phosphatase [Ornithinibacillus californiensis]|uniref:tyrosine-protein phosphatase n=1 Tax=Ornithinibacillus californiensis TaxID=161536 RepID=UPI00064DB5CA|nr:CpsB/CapC family capsule biosynthesis tyrosine phosphatase [Ornithinibacillus californiensis]